MRSKCVGFFGILEFKNIRSLYFAFNWHGGLNEFIVEEGGQDVSCKMSFEHEFRNLI